MASFACLSTDGLPVVAVATVGIALLLSRTTAICAAERLILKALLLVEVLLILCEHELRTTILANNCFIRHNFMPPLKYSDIIVTCDLRLNTTLPKGGRIQSVRTRSELDLGQAYHTLLTNASTLA